MTRWTRIAAMVIGGVVGGVVASFAVGAMRWEKDTERVARRLYGGADGAVIEPETFSPEQVDGLPAPVARYFRFALTPGQRLYRTARIEQRGQFRMGGIGSRWSPFTAVQHVSTTPPGFVWDAAIRIAPLVTVRVRDGYIDGHGVMQGKLASVLTVVNQSGQPELDAGALYRYLAEGVWFPPVLLPSRGVSWEAMDDSTARATLTQAGTSVSLEFRFGESGEVVSVYAPQRHREVKGKYELAPWEGRFTRYVRRSGMMIPSEGEVEWILPQGRLSYFRGEIVGAAYGSWRESQP
jgi:hypothetical protein